MDNPAWWSDLGADAIRGAYFGEIKTIVKDVTGFVDPIITIVVDGLCQDVGPHLKNGLAIEVSHRSSELFNWRNTLPSNCCPVPLLKIQGRGTFLYCCGRCDRIESVEWQSVRIKNSLFVPFRHNAWIEWIEISPTTRHRLAAANTHLPDFYGLRTYVRAGKQPWSLLF